MIDAIGWVATALFASSYLFKEPVTLRRTQALAAGLWIVYGAVIHAMPVVAANLIVAGLALWSSFRTPAGKRLPVPAVEDPVTESGEA